MGFDGTLVNNPAVGGASNLLNFLSEGLEFHGDGKIVWALTIPCRLPSLFILPASDCGLEFGRKRSKKLS